MNLSMRRGGLGGSTLIWIFVVGVAIIAGGFLISTFTSALLPEQASG